ncbi:MAG: bifunctional 4-hydroxy-2-oxoglutarate aldolase/2-dehydro-3-deoxy-phosphogluconate aldolase [bacterium]
MFADLLSQRIQRSGIVAVFIIDREEDGPPLARALLEGGVCVMELTLRTPAALGALRRIRAEVPEMLAGAGTVLTPGQLHEVQSAGAEFAVSPGVNPRVLQAAAEAGLPFAPGVVTPSDIETALEHGCSLMKFFPAEPSGGLSYLKAMAAPYWHLGVRFIPLGGINEKNMGTYLADPLISAIGGSWLAPREAIREARWSDITALARHATATIQSFRESSNPPSVV